MDGLAFVQMVEIELKNRHISKEQFYRESGISSATMSQWRKRIYSPSSAAIKKIEEYLGIEFSLEQKEKPILPKKNERDGSEIMFALSRGGEQEITDEMFDEVKKFAAYIAQREKDKK